MIEFIVDTQHTRFAPPAPTLFSSYSNTIVNRNNPKNTTGTESLQRSLSFFNVGHRPHKSRRGGSQQVQAIRANNTHHLETKRERASNEHTVSDRDR